MIDLKPFCGAEPVRPYLSDPFSEGEWTYATNGHIIVRVEKRDDAPELAKPINCAKVISLCDFNAVSPVKKWCIPKEGKEEECFICDGRGREHDCPVCPCECENCDGSGRIASRIFASLRGAVFDAKYLRMISVLPSLQFATVAAPEGPCAFTFEGGLGALMPCRHNYGRIPIEAEAK